MVLFRATTVDDMIKSFPTHNIVSLEGRPTYRTLNPILKSLDRCAEAIPSQQQKGHLYLTTTDAEFLAKTGDVRVTPTRPALTPTIARGATDAQIAQANKDHEKEIQQYHSHQIVTEALKKLVTENVQEMYLGEVDMSVATILEVTTHLKTRYYRISSAELNHNDQELRSS